MNNETIYYLILKKTVGKQEDNRYYIFENGQWEPDIFFRITDRLMGYDPSEPPGSPYGIGNTSIMDEIEEITYEQALELTGGNA